MLDLLLRLLPHKQLGWEEVGEIFVRFRVIGTKYFKVFIHYLDTPRSLSRTHDHPWGFISIILSGGYYERHKGVVTFRKPGQILFRPATYTHEVTTQKPAWSLVIVGPKTRDWKFK